MTDRKHGKGYVGATSKIRRRYAGLPFLGPIFVDKNQTDRRVFMVRFSALSDACATNALSKAALFRRNLMDAARP